MRKVKIAIAVISLLIIVVVGNSSGFAIPSVQATSDDGNDTQQTSQGVIQLELTPPETIVQSDNLQNPSIQESLKQQQQQQQQPVNLSSGKQQDNQGNTRSQGAQNNLPNTGDPFSLCNPYGGPCKP